MKSLTFNFGFIVSSYKLSLLRSLLTLDIFLLDMSHEIKPHWETIGYSSMNVPLLLRAFVCKVFLCTYAGNPNKDWRPFLRPCYAYLSRLLAGLSCCYASLWHFYAACPSCFSPGLHHRTVDPKLMHQRSWRASKT